MINKATIVRPVHTPIVFNESLAWSTAPVLTSEAISNIFRVASKPGSGSGSSTSQTRLNMMKYITPRKPANIDATIPIKASLPSNSGVRVISGPSARKYFC